MKKKELLLRSKWSACKDIDKLIATPMGIRRNFKSYSDQTIWEDALTTHDFLSRRDYTPSFKSESLQRLSPKFERLFNIRITFYEDSFRKPGYTGTHEEATVKYHMSQKVIIYRQVQSLL